MTILFGSAVVYGPRWDAGGVVRAVETDSAYEDSEYAEDTCERDALDRASLPK